LNARARRAAALHGIYAIVNDSCHRQRSTTDLVTLARAVVDAGIRVLQYRAKNGIVPETLRALRFLARERGVLLIVNDNVEAAVAFDCDGVHLGPGDAGFDNVAQVRANVGERLIGLSCGTPDEAVAANADDADYLGVGSVYATTSKADAGVPIGIEGLRRIAAVSRHPIAAIGGIAETNVADVARTGVAMAATIGAIAATNDSAAAARRLVTLWESART